MAQTKVLDSAGLQTLVSAIKNGDLKVGEVKTGGKVPASTLDGIIPMKNMPKGALERLVIVADDQARFALTTDQVQLGDTVKVTSTGKMYFVMDESKLSTAEGYEVYTTGTASEAEHASRADYATSAGSADKATKDSAGNTITTTYAKTSAVATKAQGAKADTAVQSVKINGNDTELKSGTSVVIPAYPTSLPASDTTSTYSATGTAPVNGKAVASAISGKADKATTLAGYGIKDAATSTQGAKADTAVQTVKIDGVEQTKTSGVVNLPAYPTTLPASDVPSWAKASSKPAYDSTEIKVKAGYAKPSSAGSVAAGDSLSVALGKIEKTVDGKMAKSTADATYIAKTDLVAITDEEITAMF